MLGFQHFSQFSKKLKQMPSLPSVLDQYEDAYNLRRYRISQISIQEAEKIYQNIEKKFYKLYHKRESGAWFENELKIFVWLLVCYIERQKKQVRQFGSEDWAFFERIFYVKHPILFQYQAKISLDYSLCLQKWSKQQDEMLSKIVAGVIKIKWSEIAKSLFIHSERKYVRTSKQCRQRWLNHLDPSKTKLTWTLEECKVLLKSVLEKGKKWAALVQLLDGRRSQHSIKNKYNSMLIKQSKLTPHQTQAQNCRSLLGELASLMASSEVNLSGSSLFRDCVGPIRQQLEIKQQQHYLQKSNASLNSTLSSNERVEKQMELNLDDLWLADVYRDGESVTELAKKVKGQKSARRGRCLESLSQMDDLALGDDMESLVYLEEIELVIRESELDR